MEGAWAIPILWEQGSVGHVFVFWLWWGRLGGSRGLDQGLDGWVV